MHMECWVVSCVVSNFAEESAVYMRIQRYLCFGSEDESSSLLRNIANRIHSHSTSSPEYPINTFHRPVNLVFDIITERDHYVKPVFGD